MKQLICEICGGTDLIKQEGVFVCQSCGCKYSADEVKKLMVQISEPVKVEGIQSKEVLFKNIETNISFGDYELAESTIKELQHLYPDDFKSWISIINMSISKLNSGFEYSEIESVYGDIVRDAYRRSLMVAKDIGEKSEIEKVYKKYISLVTIPKHTISKELLKNMFVSMECTTPYIDGPDILHVMCGFEEVDGELFYVEEGDRLHNYRTKVATNITDDLGYVISADGGYILSTVTGSYNVPKFVYNNYPVIKDYSGSRLGIYNSEFGSVNNYSGVLNTERTLLRITSLNENRLIMSGKSFSKINWIPQKDRNKSEPSKSGCYIATSVYGSYNCPEVWTLRRFRDNTLAKSWYGRAFIKIYYTISPTLVKWFGHAKWFQQFWKKRLDNMVEDLKQKGIKNSPYKDER